MSYFAAQTGRRPLAAPHPLELWPDGAGWTVVWPAPPLGVTGMLLRRGEGEPLPEVARLVAAKRRWSFPREGGQTLALAWLRGDEIGPVATLELPAEKQSIPSAARCPLCKGALEPVEGLVFCRGSCGTRWLEESPGHLVDVAALPFGPCVCCVAPRALVRAEAGPLCPTSGRLHILLPSGKSILADSVEHGLCLCCHPALPLVAAGEGLHCPAKPNNHYQRTAQGVQLLPPASPATSKELADAIDEALRRNSAQVGLHGLFVVE